MKKILIASILLAACSTVKKVEDLPGIPVEVPKEIAPIGAYSTKSNLTWMLKLVDVSNCVKNKEAFYQEVSAAEMLDTNGKTSKEVAEEIRAYSGNLETYSKWTPWKSLELATYSKASNSVLYRTQTNPRAMKEMVGTAFHESTHIMGYFHNYEYNGSKNYAKGLNLKTVPYVVGDIAMKHAEGCE